MNSRGASNVRCRHSLHYRAVVLLVGHEGLTQIDAAVIGGFSPEALPHFGDAQGRREPANQNSTIRIVSVVATALFIDVQIVAPVVFRGRMFFEFAVVRLAPGFLARSR